MSKKSQTEALEALRKYLPKGAVLWAVKRGNTPNGTMYVDFYTFTDGTISGKNWLSRKVAESLGLRFDAKRDCVRLPFMNMDPAFECTYRLGMRLHNDGYAIKAEWL